MLRDPLDLQVATTAEDFEALRADWHDLHGRASAPRLSQGFEWLSCVWAEMARPSGADLFVITGRRSGRLVMIWPLMIRRHHRFWRVLTALGTEGDYADLLLDPQEDAAPLLTAAWRLIRRTKLADAVQIERVRTDSLLGELLDARAGQVLSSQSVTVVRWDAHPSWAQYWAGLPKSFRSDIDRRARRLAEQGEVTFEVVEDGGRAELANWMLRQKHQWAERKGIAEASWLKSTHYGPFLRRANAEVSAFGRFVGFALRLDGRLIAVQLNRVDAFRVENVHIAYDPAFQKFWPGHVLTRHVLQWCCSRNLEFDFLFGDQAYKTLFGTGACRILNKSFAATGWGLVHQLLRSAAEGPWAQAQSWRRRRAAPLGVPAPVQA
jgi:CelD/BcsL family acetyltransferase involved in cellulose biosynthesis